MDASLSIVLPVRNAQAQVARQVEEALELAGELTQRFEILVVDDASSDRTEEIAAELAQRYPQVRLLRNDQPRGRPEAVKTAMQRTTGDVLFIHDSGSAFSSAQLRRLWALRNDPQLVIAQAEPRPHDAGVGLLERLTAWGEALRRSMQRTGQGGGVQMIRRQGVAELAAHEQPERQLVLERIDGAEYVSRGGGRLARPSFLSRLKSFPTAE